jgi:uncharacterized damage-inducible protein DinB
MPMDLITHYREMARNNAWSNGRLLGACARLSDEDLSAGRVSFFPSLQETLNHILAVDLFYLAALEEGRNDLALFRTWTPRTQGTRLQDDQLQADRRLIAFCDRLDESLLARKTLLDRGQQGLKEDTVGRMLPHLFIHQIHHRGQAHAMLAGTPLPPPQLDEFFLSEDRAISMAELGALGIGPG